MSKPETPKAPCGCRYKFSKRHTWIDHDQACATRHMDNAPKAEAKSKPETPCLPGCKKTFSQSSNGGMTIGTDHAANCQNASDSDRKCPACGGGEPGTLCRVQASKAEAGPWNGFGEKPHPEDWPKAEAPPAPEPEGWDCERCGKRVPGPYTSSMCVDCWKVLNPAPPAMNCDCGHAKVLHRGSPVKCLPRCGCTIDWGLTPQDMQRILGTPLSAPPAPVSEPPIDWDAADAAAKWIREAKSSKPKAGRVARAYLALKADLVMMTQARDIIHADREECRAELDALKAQLDTDREVLKETENNISNLAKFAASPITPNYNLPMSGLAIAIRDSLAAALGREILLTQEWDALKAQNATLTAERDEARATKDMHKERQQEAWAEVERLRENVGVKYGATGMCQDRHPMVMFPSAGGWGENCPMCAARAAREAGKA